MAIGWRKMPRMGCSRERENGLEISPLTGRIMSFGGRLLACCASACRNSTLSSNEMLADSATSDADAYPTADVAADPATAESREEPDRVTS